MEYSKTEKLILVADDDSTLRKLVIMALATTGHHILEAADGLAALALFCAHRETIALVVTDITMPGLNGLQLVQAILAIASETSVLYMSGNSLDDPIALNHLRERRAEFLAKPFTPAVLQSAVNGLFRAEALSG